MIDLSSLKYAELRKLAKKANIKANQKQEKLIAELTKYYEESGELKSKASLPENVKSPKVNHAKKLQKKTPATCTPSKTPVSAARKTQATIKPGLKNKSLPTTPLLTAKPRTPVTGKVNTPLAKKGNTPIAEKVNTPLAAKTGTPGSAGKVNTPTVKKVSTPLAAKTGTPASAGKVNTPSVKKVSTPVQVKPDTPRSAAQTPSTPGQAVKKALRWEKKVFTPVSRSGSPAKKTSATKRKSTDTGNSHSPTKKRRSTFEKAPTPNLSSPCVSSPKKRRSSLRNCDSSPGVKEMLGKMTTNMSDQEMKQSLMSAIDQKVQEKVKTTAPNSTSIPRFVAFAKKRNETKPITPGNKDWDKIHKKNFSKFDSIDVYLNKKRKRAEEMSASVKKAKTLLEEVHSAVNKLKSHKTPQSNENKFVKPRNSNVNKTTPFKPTVLNTTRMNLNFGAKRSPKTMPRKSPVSVITEQDKDVKPVTQARKSTGSSMHRKSTTTPFKFTAPLPTTLNKTVTSTKKTFDLQASLARPLTWKPHKGKLKPMEHVAAKSPVYNKVASTAKSQATRKTTRATIAQRRANKKDQARMARRGIDM